MINYLKLVAPPVVQRPISMSTSPRTSDARTLVQANVCGAASCVHNHVVVGGIHAVSSSHCEHLLDCSCNILLPYLASGHWVVHVVAELWSTIHHACQCSTRDSFWPADAHFAAPIQAHCKDVNPLPALRHCAMCLRIQEAP